MCIVCFGPLFFDKEQPTKAHALGVLLLMTTGQNRPSRYFYAISVFEFKSLTDISAGCYGAIVVGADFLELNKTKPPNFYQNRHAFELIKANPGTPGGTKTRPHVERGPVRRNMRKWYIRHTCWQQKLCVQILHLFVQSQHGGSGQTSEGFGQKA